MKLFRETYSYLRVPIFKAGEIPIQVTPLR